MLVPVRFERVNKVEQYDGQPGKGWAVTCGGCGLCRTLPDNYHPAGKAAKRALAELNRLHPGRSCGHLYRDRTPAGVRLEWEWRGERKPAHWVKNTVCGAGVDVGDACPVFVVCTDPAANKAAEKFAARVRRRWQNTTFLPAAPPVVEVPPPPPKRETDGSDLYSLIENHG